MKELIRRVFLNPIIANLINLFNLLIFLLALKYDTQTVPLISICIFNCSFYLTIYFLFNKKLLINYKTKNWLLNLKDNLIAGLFLEFKKK